MNQQRLLERFLRYVKIDTTAREEADRYPSSPGQLELGKLLVEELRQAGLEDVVQDWGLPGAIWLVRDGDGLWMGAKGYADLVSRTPMRVCNRTWIASINKAFTAAVTLLLAEEGLLGLDDLITEWLPAEIADRFPYAESITIRRRRRAISTWPMGSR